MAPNGGTDQMVVLAGNTHPKLADDICARLELKRTEIVLYHAGNRETMLQLVSSVRFKHVYIVQTATETNVNDAIMELLLMGYTCRTSAAKNIVGVVPYLPYGKQSRQRKRGAIPARLLAKLIGRAGFNRIITVDLHHKEIQGFFDIPVENLRASPFLIAHLRMLMLESGWTRQDLVIVAEHTSAVRKASAYAQRLKTDLAIIHGTEDSLPEMEIDGRSSPPPVTNIEFFPGAETLPVWAAPRPRSIEWSALKLVGNVSQRIAIMVENILDDVQFSIRAANFLKQEEGAKKVILVATHALFGRDGARQLAESCIDEIVLTNTIPHEVQALDCPKIKTIDISILLTEAIRRLHNNESLSYLFSDVAMED